MISAERVAGLLNMVRGLAEDADAELQARHATKVAECSTKHAGRPSLQGRLDGLEADEQQSRHLVERGHLEAVEGVMAMLTAAGCYPGPTREGGER